MKNLITGETSTQKNGLRKIKKKEIDNFSAEMLKRGKHNRFPQKK